MGVSYDCAHVRLISALCMSLVFITVLFVSFFMHKCESFITRAMEEASNDRMICPVCPVHTMFCFSCGRAWDKSSPDGVFCGHSDCSKVTRFKILQEALFKVPIFLRSLPKISMRLQFDNYRWYQFVRPYNFYNFTFTFTFTFLDDFSCASRFSRK